MFKTSPIYLGGIMSETYATLQKSKENAYREYIDNHRFNVQKAWNTMKANTGCIELICRNLNTSADAAISLIDDMIKNHDLSKYQEEEFDAYRKHFYPVTPEEKEESEDQFNKAWEHHFSNNMHHWDWWSKTGNADNMPFANVVEMICDWEAMGYKFGNTSREWYEKNRDTIMLGDKQRKFAEELMCIYCK